jgi:hypothetical protein
VTDDEPKRRDPFRVSPEGYVIALGICWAALVLKAVLERPDAGSGDFLQLLLVVTAVLVGAGAVVIVIDALCHGERPRWPFIRPRQPKPSLSHPDFSMALNVVSKKITAQEFLRRRGETDGARLAANMILDAVSRQHANDLEVSLALSTCFDAMTAVPRDLLCALADADWHHSHEDIISRLDSLRDPGLIPVFVKATQWLPHHMAWDVDNRGLALRAIRAIAKIDDPKADEALSILAQSGHVGMRALAERKLRERAERAKG